VPTRTAGSQDAYRRPFADDLEYVASWTAIGLVGGFLAWAVADFASPQRQYRLGIWTLWGSGLCGAGALAWLFFNTILY